MTRWRTVALPLVAVVVGSCGEDVSPEQERAEVVEELAAAEDPEATGDLRDQVIDAFAACDALEPLLEPG